MTPRFSKKKPPFARWPLLAGLALALAGPPLAGQGTDPRESILDQVVHLEDSLSHTLPPLPPLCDLTDSKKRRIDIGGCELFVETEGRGVPVVLISGGPGGTHHYFHPGFSRLKQTCQVIYYDQRGTGRSDFSPGPGGYSFRQAVDDLDKLREELGLDQWFVCGFSYGGALAQYYAATYPQRVQGLILISALPLFESDRFVDEQEKYLAPAELERRQEIIREYRAGHLSREAFLYNLALNGDWKRQHFYKPSPEEMIRSALYEWVNDRDFNGIMSSDTERYNLMGAFDACPIATLIVEGKNDLTWGPGKAGALHENHPNAQFIVYNRAGHSLYQDVPELFFTALEAFVKDAKPASARQIRKWQRQTAEKLRPDRPY